VSAVAPTTLPLPVELLPHEPPIVLLDSLEAIDETSATCRLRMRADLPFVTNGAVPSMFGIEVIAQAVGVHAGYRARTNGEPIRVGYLISVRDASFEVAELRVGDELEINVVNTAGETALATYTGTIARDGQVVIKASIGVYREER